MVPEGEIWSLMEFPKVSPGVQSVFLPAWCECRSALPREAGVPGGISSSKKSWRRGELG